MSAGSAWSAVVFVDVTCLCYRALFASIAERSQVRPDEIQAYVLERFFGSLLDYTQFFSTGKLVFCFDDHLKSLRREVYPTYKHKRKEREKSPEEIHAIREAGVIIGRLKNDILPMCGFNNLWWQSGLEADDMLAWGAQYIQADRVVLVTDDADLYQCLRPNVSMFKPGRGKLYKLETFKEDYGITPEQWALVKATAGCTSDNVEGLDGIGEATAIKYLRGEHPARGKRWETLVSEEGKAVVQRNLPLVTLPHAETKLPLSLAVDNISIEATRKCLMEFNLQVVAGRLGELEQALVS